VKIELSHYPMSHYTKNQSKWHFVLSHYHYQMSQSNHQKKQ